MKLLAPYFMRFITKKAGQHFEQAFGSAQQSTSPQKEEGSISIDKIPTQQRKSNDSVGEYVDFEEVK